MSVENLTSLCDGKQLLSMGQDPTGAGNCRSPRKQTTPSGPAILCYRLILRLSRKKDEHGKPRGYAFAFCAWYAKALNRTVRTIYNYIAELRRCGWIETDEHAGIRLLIRPLLLCVPPRSASTPTPRKPFSKPPISGVDAREVSGVSSISSVTTGRQQTQRQRRPKTESVPDPMTAVVVDEDIKPEEEPVIAAMTDEAENLAVTKARELVRRYGESVCRRHLEALKRERARKFVPSPAGWLICAIRGGYKYATGTAAGHTGQSSRPQSHSSPPPPDEPVQPVVSSPVRGFGGPGAVRVNPSGSALLEALKAGKRPVGVPGGT